MENINYLTAFLGGIVSVLSPCVLPVIPGFIGYLAEHSFSEKSATGDSRVAANKVAPTKQKTSAILHALMLSLGFSLNFFIIGTAAGALGKFILFNQTVLLQLSGLIIIILGLIQLGTIKTGKIFRSLNINTKKFHGLSYFGSFLLGMILTFGWAPCFGPIIGAIFTLAANGQTYQQSIAMFIFYSLGFSLPIIVIAIFLDQTAQFTQKYKKIFHLISKTAGIIFVIIGIAMITNYLPSLANFINQFYIHNKINII